MEFHRLPSRPGLIGLAALALLLAAPAPLAAEPAQELRQSIDQAGTAINRQLGGWLGVTPEKPAKRKAKTTAPRPKAAAIPLPTPRPADLDGQSAEATPRTDGAPVSVEARITTPAVSAPLTLAPPSSAVSPLQPRPSRRPDPVSPARATLPEREEEPDATSPAAENLAGAPTTGASVPLPPPAPERQLAALPPPKEEPSAEPVSPPAAAPTASETLPTICPELSGEDIGVFTPIVVTATKAACTVDRGVSLSAVRMKDGRLVTLEPAAVLRCEMAAAVARWLREGVEPAVATLGAPLDKVLVAASQQCRPRNRVAGAKVSEHGRGNAIDTRGYVLKDGRRFVIGTPAKGSAELPMPVAFQERLKASACADFTTILGPGSDGYHELHLHVDRAERRSGMVLCRWAVADQTKPVPRPPVREEAKIPSADAPADGAAAGDSPAPEGSAESKAGETRQ